MKQFLFLTFLIGITGTGLAQTKNYFQQKVDYKISVTLHDGDHSLSAFEEIVYHNNSPIALDKIYFHLWPNAYKNNKTALARQLLQSGKSGLYYADTKDQGWIDSLNFIVDQKAVRWEILNEDTPDVAVIYLNSPIPSGGKINITTPFHVKLPASFSRMGHIDQRYQITQWYPKPAVYDHQGWNYMPYLNQGEFYSEFGSFDVSITAPKNYVIGASGNLQTTSEAIWLDSLAQANENSLNDTSAKKTTQNKTEVSVSVGFGGKKSKKKTSIEIPASSSEWKTIRYTLDQVHDFAWFADKSFQVLKSSVQLPESKKTVTTWLMYTPENAVYWKKAKPYIDSSIYYYSLWVGDYPYSVCTAVDGALSAGGGMEYPTITIISPISSGKELDVVIAHEVGHNWFYGILASNERQHTWMDEGMNSYFEERYVSQRYGKGGFDQFGGMGAALKYFIPEGISLDDLTYYFQAGRGKDQSLGLRGDEFTDFNYGALCYKKTAMNFRYLAAYLGQNTFDEIMHQYYREWQFKHPYPADIKMVFEKQSNKNLDWFFGDLLNTAKTMDYSISKKHGDIIITNKGEISAPIPVDITYSNGKTETQWVEGNKPHEQIGLRSSLKVESAQIDPKKVSLDMNWGNNATKKQYDLKSGTGIATNGGRFLYWLPLLGNNANDGWMPGVVIHNAHIPASKWDFQLMPLYGIASKKIVGSGELFRNIRPLNGNIQKIRVGGLVRQYSYQNLALPLTYSHFQPRIDITFGHRGGAYTTKEKTLSLVMFSNAIDNYTKDGSGNLVYTQRGWTAPIYRAQFHQNQNKPINPSQVNIELEGNKDYWKFGLTLEQRISYQQKGKGIDIRAYAGKMGVMSTDVYPLSLGYWSSPGIRVLSYSGSDDYTLEQVMPCRSSETGLFAKNRVQREGGLRIAVPYNQYLDFGVNTNWVGSINLTAHLPIKFPLQVYADAATFSGASSLLSQQKKLLYVAGLQYEMFKIGKQSTITINLPLIYSEDLKMNLGRYSGFFNTVMVSAKFNLMNPISFLR